MERIELCETERKKEKVSSWDATPIFSKETEEQSETEKKIDQWNKLIVNNSLLSIEEKGKKLEKIKNLEITSKNVKDIYMFFSKEQNWAKELFKKIQNLEENPKWNITMQLIEWIIVFFLNDKESLSNFETIKWNGCLESPKTIMGKSIKTIIINRIGIKENKKRRLKDPRLWVGYSQEDIQKYKNTPLKEIEDGVLNHEIQHYNNDFLIDYENEERVLSAVQDEIIAQVVNPSGISSDIALEISKIFALWISEGAMNPGWVSSGYSHANRFYDWDMNKYYKNQIFILENLDEWADIARKLKKTWIKEYADILAITPLTRRSKLENIYLTEEKMNNKLEKTDKHQSLKS